MPLTVEYVRGGIYRIDALAKVFEGASLRIARRRDSGRIHNRDSITPSPPCN